MAEKNAMSSALEKKVDEADASDIVALPLAALRAGTTAALSESIGMPENHQRPKWRCRRVVLAHEGRVCSLAVDVDNAWVASGGADNMISLWDIASGQRRQFFTGHVATVRGLAVSERSPFLFSCGEDRQVKCWDLETCKSVRDFFGHLSAVYAVAAHPSHDIIVTCGRDATVRVWDIRSKSCVRMFEGHTGSALSISVSPAEPQIVSGGDDGLVYLWDIGSGRALTCLTRHHKPVRAVAHCPTESVLVSVGSDALRRWKLPYGEYMAEMIPQLTPNCMWSCCALSPVGDLLVVGAEYGAPLRFYDWQTRAMFQEQTIRHVPGLDPMDSLGVNACAFDRSGERLFTAENDKTIKWWIAEKEETA